MRPVDLFDYAEALLGSAETEVAHRNVVGRLYYAAYHLALQKALTDGFIPEQTGEDHGRQMRHFAAHSDVRLRPLGRRLLPDLRRLRNIADYDLAVDFPPELADQAMDWAADVFALLGGR
jgi:hypothetical protein